MADEKDLELEKAKAAAAAKAKAAAAAKAKAAATAKTKVEAGQTEVQAPVTAQAEAADNDATNRAETDDVAAAKAKAIAAAKAKAAAAAAAKAKAAGESQAAGGDEPASEAESDDPKAKAIAAAKAKAAAIAAAKAKAAGGAQQDAGETVEAEKPSKNRPMLDAIVKRITEKVGSEAIESSYINFMAKELPTIIVKKEKIREVANLLKQDEELQFQYISNLHGTDFETYMEVYYFVESFTKKYKLAMKVKIDRDQAQLPSVTPVWDGANWQEREAYDLLGIHFEGHPNLTRMFLPETWVGHPLRKDYVQYDEEV